MSERETFEILGIEATKDEEAIRAAYREKVVSVNPEDDPEGFKKLRTAYENAIRLINGPAEGEEKSEEDMTEVELHVKKAEAIYDDIKKRSDVSLWEEWLNHPLCQGLDTVDEMREAFLTFALDRFFLSHDVWVKIDKVFTIKDERKLLCEMFPPDFIDYVIFHVDNEDFFEVGKLKTREEYLELIKNTDIEDTIIREKGNDYVPEEFHNKADEYIRDASSISMLIEKMINPQYSEEDRHNAVMQMKSEQYYFGHSDVWHPFEYVGAMRLMQELGELEKADYLARCVLIDELFDFECYLYSTAAFIIVNAQRIRNEKNGTEGVGDINLDAVNAGIKRVLDERPKFMLARIAKSVIYYLNGEYTESKDEIMGVLEDDNRNEVAVSMMRMINEKLIVSFKEKIEAEPENLKERIELGWCLFQKEDGKGTIELLEGIEPDKDNEYDYHNLIGRCYFNLEEYEKAEPHLAKWLELITRLYERSKTEDTESWSKEDKKRVTRLGYCYYMNAACKASLKNYEDGEKLMRISIEKENDANERIYYQESLGLILHEEKKYDEEMVIWNEMIENTPHCVPAFVHRQEVAYELRDAGCVVDDYYNIVADVPQYARAYVLAAKVFHVYRQEDELNTLLERAKENDIKSDALDSIRANLLRAHGDYKEAYKLLTDIETNISKNDTDIDSPYEFYIDFANLFLNMGNRHIRPEDVYVYDNRAANFKHKKATGHFAYAIYFCEKAMELDPANKRSRWVLSDIYEAMDDRESCEAVYREMLELDPADADINFEFGAYYHRKNNLHAAYDQYKETLKKNPDHKLANNKLMKLYEKSFLDKEKKEFYDSAVKYAAAQLKNDDDSYYYVERALLYIDGYEFDKAIEDAKAALKSDPENFYAMNAAGYSLMMLERYEEAEEYFKKGIEVMGDEKPETPHLHMNLARCSEMQWKYEQAIECYFFLNEHFGDDMNGHMRMGVIYGKNKKYKEAAGEYLYRHDHYTEQKKNDKNNDPWIDERIIANVVKLVHIYRLAGDMENYKEWSLYIHRFIQRKNIMNLLSNLKMNDNEKEAAVYILKEAGKHSLFVERDYKLAIKYFEKAQKLMKKYEELNDVDDLATLGDINSDLADCYARLGQKTKSKLSAEMAIKCYTKKSGSVEEYLGFRKELPFRLGELAMLYFFMGDEKKAFEFCDRMQCELRCSFCREKKCYEKYLALARIYELKKDNKKALEMYEQALIYGPDDCEVKVAIELLSGKKGV